MLQNTSTSPNRRIAPAVAFALLLSMVVSGCIFESGDGNETAAPPEDAMSDESMGITLATTDIAAQNTGAYPATIAYTPNPIQVEAGHLVNLTYTNTDQNPLGSHDWALEVDGAIYARTAVIGTGETDNVTFMAPAPGAYAYYCSVPGHRGQGMEGTFEVIGEAATGGGNTTSSGNNTTLVW